MKTFYQSKDHKIELKIIGYNEPNNGRSLHIAELHINGKDFSDQYFENGWNRLNFNLDNFQFESKDSQHIFIPVEGNSFIINTNTLSVIKIPFKALSTIYFEKNEFLEDQITVYYTNEIIVISLKVNDQ